MAFETPKSLLLLIATITSLGLGGCSRSEEIYVPTRGQVFVGDKPAEGALVTLVPLSGEGNPESARPTGVVGADGTFTVSTFDPKARKTLEGAIPGKYGVMITWYPQAQIGTPVDREAPRFDRLGGRYQDASRNSFQAVVAIPTTELTPIRLNASDDLGRRRK